MHALLLVRDSEISVIAAPGAARIGKHQDATFAVIEIGRIAASLGFTQLLHFGGAVLPSNDALGATSDLGDGIGAKMVDDLVENAFRYFQRGEVFEQSISSRDGVRVLDYVARSVNDRPDALVAIVVDVWLVQRGRERMLKILHQHVARGQVEFFQVLPGVAGLGEPPLHRGFVGVDQLHDDRAAGVELPLGIRQQRGRR